MILRTIAFAVALATAVAAIAEQSPQPTFLGVVDEQGLMTPIAVHDGHSWWNRWPWGADRDDVRALRVPRSLTSIPAEWLPPGLRLPASWKALHPSGALIPFRALRPIRPDSPQLMDTIAIRTTYRARRRGGAEELIAISGPGVVGRFVSPTSREAQPILRQLAARIAALERAAVDEWKAEHREVALAPVFRVESASGVEYRLERPADFKEFDLVRATDPLEGKRYYYLAGEKLFRMNSQDGCMMNLSSSGIVVVGAGGKVVSERISSATYDGYCGDAPTWMTPLVTLRLHGHTMWIVKDGVEDGYDYSLLDAATGERRVLKKD